MHRIQGNNTGRILLRCSETGGRTANFCRGEIMLPTQPQATVVVLSLGRPTGLRTTGTVMALTGDSSLVTCQCRRVVRTQ